jgi:hypothetical protein
MIQSRKNFIAGRITIFQKYGKRNTKPETAGLLAATGTLEQDAKKATDSGSINNKE